MRFIATTLVILVALVAIALVGGNMYIANGDHRETIQTQATNALGREVTIGEVTRASLFPNPGFGVSELVIANADGMTDPYFASVAQAEIGVKLMPLLFSLGKDIQINAFVLTNPEVNLEKRADGEVNWMLGAAETAPAEETSSNGGGSALDNRDINLGKVQLTDGKITYRDLAADQMFVAEDADINLTLTSLDNPMNVDGSMFFQGEPAKLTARVATPRALIDNEAGSIALKFSVADNSVDTTINLAGGELAYNGTLDIDAPSLKSLLATLGMPLPVENGFNNLSISGNVTGSATRMSFTDADITFDKISNDTTGNTDVTFDWGGTRPKVSGQIDLSALDLRPYLPEPSEQMKKVKAEKGASFPPWPSDQIDFSVLQAVDVDLKATTDGIFLHGMEFGESGLDLNITNGLLTAALTELNLYDGGGRGTLRVNSRERFPTVELRDINLTGMNAQSFATEVLGISRIRGVGGVQANLTARGTSVEDFMRTLGGTGSFDIDQGSVEGVDIGKIVKSAAALLDGFQGGSFNVGALGNAVSVALGPDSETQFTDLDSRFRINNGLVQAENILMQGPFFLIEGDGTVNLPAQSMDMEFIPTVYETLEAVSGRKLNIPLQITGTFNNPKIGFDTAALLEGAVGDRLRGLLGNATGVQLDEEQSIEDNLRGLAVGAITDRLGLGESTPTAEEVSEEQPSPEEEIANQLINGLFGSSKKDD